MSITSGIKRWTVRLLAAAFVSCLLTTALARSASIKPTPYVDPAQLTSVPFGASSQWAQPWRGYLETVPATTFIDGLGIYLDTEDQSNQNLLLKMLGTHGIRHARILIPWGDLDWQEQHLASANTLTHMLLAAKANGLRPLIMLYSYQSQPCPVRYTTSTLTRGAHAGDTTISLVDTTGIEAGYSGLDTPDERLPGRDGPYAAAPYPPTLNTSWPPFGAGNLITRVSSHAIVLAKPLKAAIPEGSALRVTTLKYRPFSVPGSADYNRTMSGWLHYVRTVVSFMTNVLGTATSKDKGFDLEIWNELSESPHFLFVNDYYGRIVYKYDEQSIYRNLLLATTRYVAGHAAAFDGVQIGDGIASNIPWPASSTEPAQITAVDKHLYQRRITYPRSTSPLMAFDRSVIDTWSKVHLNALGQRDTSTYEPSYSAFFPEFYATYLRTDSVVRDMAPITTAIDGVAHGRLARKVGGKVVPTPVWITEVGLEARQDWPRVSVDRDLYIQAKADSRYYCFFLAKGATQVDIYAAVHPDSGLLSSSILSLASKPGATYPTHDASYTTPALMVTARIVQKMRQALDLKVRQTRPIEVLSVADTHNHAVFQGDGSAAHPTLYDRDVFTFLPFEVNPHRFVIPYYVMTRDIMRDLAPERFTVSLAGVDGTGAEISAYDPMHNRSVPVSVTARSRSGVDVVLQATDYPYLLTIQDR